MTFDDLDRPPLDRTALLSALVTPDSLWRDVEVVAYADSTNAALAERARAGAPAGLVLVAEHQRAGRGRLDRVWVTPPRAALTFSMLLRPDRVPVARWPWLPLLVGIAVAEAVRRVAGVECGLKWPNDVMVGERKLAGILVERLESPATGAAAVVGVGLNVSTSVAELPVPTATSLALENATTLDRSVVLRELLRIVSALTTAWAEEDGVEGLRQAYTSRCTTLGQQVRVEVPGGPPLRGTAVAVDSAGRLVVDSPDGRVSVGAGDVIHLRSLGGGAPGVT